MELNTDHATSPGIANQSDCSRSLSVACSSSLADVHACATTISADRHVDIGTGAQPTCGVGNSIREGNNRRNALYALASVLFFVFIVACGMIVWRLEFSPSDAESGTASMIPVAGFAGKVNAEHT